MSRLSVDQLDEDGTILNGYDYHLQVWVLDGICTEVGGGSQYAGRRVAEVPGHETRTP